MNRKLRVTFRNGDVRMGDFPADRTLAELWGIFKRDGAIIGDVWCAQFDFVAMIEVVETTGGAAADSPTQGERGFSPAYNPIDRLAIVTGTGSFKPPGEA